jgi:3-oxoacyl-[acyl-carrier protein] reductase
MGAYHSGELNGYYYTTCAVLPNMIERQTGDWQPSEMLTSAYSASKFAVLGLTEL